MDKEKIKNDIDNVIMALEKLKLSIFEDFQFITQENNKKDSVFEQLKQALLSNKWPEAVNKHLICDPNNEEDKIERGRGIIELMIEERMNGIKFLDFGCGEGHSAQYAATEKATLSVGYDVKNYNWNTKFADMENLKFVTDFKSVSDNGPYDVILLFDVIDHVINESPEDILKKAASVLAPKGKIYMRTHPLTSRHATHLYHHLNKAYLHLIFTEEELKEIVPEQHHFVHNNGPTRPLLEYGKMINAAELKELTKREIKESVEEFFKTPIIANRIMEKISMTNFPEFQLSLCFIDYVLSK